MKPDSLLPSRDERRALAALVAVTVVVLAVHLAFEMAGPAVFAVAFTPETEDGAMAIHRGVVDDVRWTEAGGHLVMVVGGVQVFVPASVAPATAPAVGEVVRVTGTVQTYRGEKEIMVRDAGDIVRSP